MAKQDWNVATVQQELESGVSAPPGGFTAVQGDTLVAYDPRPPVFVVTAIVGLNGEKPDTALAEEFINDTSRLFGCSHVGYHK